MKLTFFMLLKTTNAWLRLAPAERFAFLGKSIEPILRVYPSVRLRFFDAEAFTGRVSDVAIWETDDLKAWHGLIDSLRETPFWGGYFEVLEIIPSVENQYAVHYDVAPVGEAKATWG